MELRLCQRQSIIGGIGRSASLMWRSGKKTIQSANERTTNYQRGAYAQRQMDLSAVLRPDENIEKKIRTLQTDEQKNGVRKIKGIIHVGMQRTKRKILLFTCGEMRGIA